MADIFDKEKRSQVMSRIRGRDTEVERIVFGYLRKQGVYFQKHYRSKKLGMNMDIALPRKKKAVFVDGDFWHGRDYAKRKPKLSEFWRNKIERNMERDAEQRALLRDDGWRLLCVWESDIKRKSTREEELEKIVAFLVSDKR